MADQNSNSPPVCMVTGGTAGVGLATACLFAQHGYQVAVCGRDQAKLEQAACRINEFGPENVACFAESCDLQNCDDAKRFARSVVDRFGRVDVLVNNAAKAPLSPFADISEETFEQTLAINIRSVFYTTQVIWRKMIEQGSGVVVNISSLAAVDPFTGFSLYGSTKAWADLITTALADEGAAHSIRAYSIRPGAVETAMLRGLFPDFPADQCVSPEDVATKIWECVSQPDSHPSGTHYPVTNQS